MKIQYTYRSIQGDNTQSHWGVGSMESFPIGLSTTSHIGVLSNTTENDLPSPILVTAAMTDKSITTVTKMNRIIDEHEIPVNTFFFIPSQAYSSWYQSSLDGNFWASLPKFTLIAGKSYDGFYVPLSALPPFSARAEFGAMSPSYETLHYSDFFYMSAGYFQSTINPFSNRISNGKKIISVVGDDVSYGKTRMQNANSFRTFNDILYTEAAANGKGGSPKLNVQIKRLIEREKNGVTMNIPEFILSTDIPKKSKYGFNDSDINISGRKGMYTLGNSGFINNIDISFDSLQTQGYLPTDLKSIMISKDARVVSSIEYIDGGGKYVNLYVPL